MAFLPSPDFIFHSGTRRRLWRATQTRIRPNCHSEWRCVIKAAFSGGFAEICFHQNSLEMFCLRRAGRILQTFKTREGVQIDRNQDSARLYGQKKGRDARETATLKRDLDNIWMSHFRGSARLLEWHIFSLNSVCVATGGRWSRPGEGDYHSLRTELRDSRDLLDQTIRE